VRRADHRATHPTIHAPPQEPAAMRARERAFLIAGLVVVATLAYGHVLMPGRVIYSPHSDIVAYHLGAKEALYRSVQSGRGVPFWRSDQLAGGPALTNPNSMYTYPFHFPFLILPPGQAVGWVVWMHAVMAAIGFFLLGEHLGLGRWPSLLMGMAGLFNFKNVVALYAGWILPSLTWLPWIFLAVLSAVRNPGARTGMAAAVVAATALHAGHLQLVYHSLLFVLAYLAAHTVRACRAREFGALRRVAGWLLAAAALGAGLSAYLLIPMLAEAPLVSRTRSSYEFLQAGHALSPLHLLTLIDPEVLGTPRNGTYYRVELWEDVAYFGIVPLALAVVGAIRRRGQWPVTYFACAFVVSLVCALDTPIARALYAAVPGFALFRIPGRVLFLTAFFGIVLAGYGAAELLAMAAPPQRRQSLAIVSVAIALIAAEGTFRVHRYVTTAPLETVRPAPDLAAVLSEDTGVFRTLPIRPTLNYGSAAAANLQIVTGYDPYNLTHYGDFIELLRGGRLGEPRARVWTDVDRMGRRDVLDALNVKYVLSPEPLAADLPNLSLVARLFAQPVFVFYSGVRTQDVYVYRNGSYRPRAFWADRVVTRRSADVRLAVTAADLRHTAVVERPVEEPEVTAIGSPNDSVHVEHASGGRLVLDTQSTARRFLVISEVYHPGWRGTLDGAPRALERTDHALLGAWVPPGSHRIELLFRPLYWPHALALSSCSAAVFMALAAVHAWRTTTARRRG
jgi:hypothetical protein